MKKMILCGLIGLALLGAGCANTGSNNSVEIKTNTAGYSYFGADIEKFSTDQLFATASDSAGFGIYFPKFVPAGLAIDKKFIWDKNSANIGLSESADSAQPKIIIQENLTSSQPNAVTKRLGKLKSVEKITLQGGHAGYYGVYEPAEGVQFNTIITTGVNLDIGIWSKFYDKTELIKIANSLVSVK